MHNFVIISIRIQSTVIVGYSWFLYFRTFLQLYPRKLSYLGDNVIQFGA